LRSNLVNPVLIVARLKVHRRSENSIAIGGRGFLVKNCGGGFELEAGAGSVVEQVFDRADLLV
jgi:hypothetical protein